MVVEERVVDVGDDNMACVYIGEPIVVTVQRLKRLYNEVMCVIIMIQIWPNNHQKPKRKKGCDADESRICSGSAGAGKQKESS